MVSARVFYIKSKRKLIIFYHIASEKSSSRQTQELAKINILQIVLRKRKGEEGKKLH